VGSEHGGNGGIACRSVLGKGGEFRVVEHGTTVALDSPGVLILLSPAKRLDYETPVPTRKFSEPRMVDRSAELMSVLVKTPPDDVASLMSLSPTLTDLNVQRYQDWEPHFSPDNARPAVFAFDGDTYAGLDVARFGERDLTHAQKTIRILSGLHGVLRPLDLVQPYRLEMGTKLRTARGNDLYAYWGTAVTETINDDLAERKSKVVVNLASNEYFGVIQPEHLQARLVTPTFLDEVKGQYKVVSFHAKKARGAMAAWLVLNRVSAVRALQDFDDLGYHYDSERSTPDAPVFVRPAA